MERFILIDAQSSIYSVKEVVAEKKAVARLQCILNSFKAMEQKFSGKGFDAKLKVTTGIHNPELPLK